MAMGFISFCFFLFFLANFANGLGINWGSTTSHNLQPKTTQKLLLANGIDSVKLYESHDSMITAFANSGISVMVGIPNEDLQKFSDNLSEAKYWVKNKIEKHVKEVNITYVAVGNEPFSQRYNGMYLNTTFKAIKNIQQALGEAGLGEKIKATTPLNEDVYDSPTKPPTQSDFRKDIKGIVVEMVRWFDKNKSPFIVNINPFRSYSDGIYTTNLDFVLNFTHEAKKVISDHNATYNNVFDVSIDKLAWSLKSAGVPDIKIVVGEIGWPTDGNIYANKTLAEKFYAGFLKKLGTNEGTPLRPGPIEVYLSSLLDENMRNIDQGNHERHWGIFTFEGIPKYPIDFSCQGRENITAVQAENVKKLSGFYCIYNQQTQTSSQSVIDATEEYICKAADCTALTYGSSCNHLSKQGNLSYMFNMYFQMYDQAEHSCNFNGLATFSYVNQDNGTCHFPIQMMSAALFRVAFGTSEIVVGVLAMVLLALLSKDTF